MAHPGRPATKLQITDTERLVLLCHKRSRTFTVAQYGQCPKALASATLN